MEGLIAVIFVVIGIVNFIAKQQQDQKKEQGSMKRQPAMKGQNPLQQWMSTPHQPNVTARNAGKHQGGSIMDEGEYASVSAFAEENEGIEIEDRRRVGSLDYIEQSESSEGMCDEHPEHAQKNIKEKKAAAKVEVIGREEGIAFEFTEESLINSIIMTEILGQPRSMKRSIR